MLWHRLWGQGNTWHSWKKILLCFASSVGRKYTLKYIQTFEDVIDKTRHVYYKPIIYMFKVKYMSSVEKNKEKIWGVVWKGNYICWIIGWWSACTKIIRRKKERFLATRRLSHVALFHFMLDWNHNKGKRYQKTFISYSRIYNCLLNRYILML